MDEEMIRRLLNREYPNLGRNSTRTRNESTDDPNFNRNLPQQSHTHEFTASTLLAQTGNNRHNHRFSGVTSEIIPLPGGDHKHAILTNTDSFGHHHEVGVETGPAIDVGDGKHVHFVSGETTLDDFHFHGYQFTTLIQNPLIVECECECKCDCRHNNR